MTNLLVYFKFILNKSLGDRKIGLSSQSFDLDECFLFLNFLLTFIFIKIILSRYTATYVTAWAGCKLKLPIMIDLLP